MIKHLPEIRKYSLDVIGKEAQKIMFCEKVLFLEKTAND